MNDGEEWGPLPYSLREFLAEVARRMEPGSRAPTRNDRQWARLQEYLERGDWPRETAALLGRVWIISYAQAFAQQSGLVRASGTSEPAAPAPESGSRVEIALGSMLYARATVSFGETPTRRTELVRLRLARDMGLPVQPPELVERPGLDEWGLEIRFNGVTLRRGELDARAMLRLGPHEVRELLERGTLDEPLRRDLLRFWRAFFRPTPPAVKALCGDPLEGYKTPLADLTSHYLSSSKARLRVKFMLSALALGAALGRPELLCGRTAVALLAKRLKHHDPALARELSQTGARERLGQVLRRLLEERVSVKRLATVVARALERPDADLAEQTEAARRDLGSSIAARYADPSGILPYFEVEPGVLESADATWLEQLTELDSVRADFGRPLVLITDASQRRAFFERTRDHLGDHAVLSWDELDARAQLRCEGWLGPQGLRVKPRVG